MLGDVRLLVVLVRVAAVVRRIEGQRRIDGDSRRRRGLHRCLLVDGVVVEVEGIREGREVVWLGGVGG